LIEILFGINEIVGISLERLKRPSIQAFLVLVIWASCLSLRLQYLGRLIGFSA
jgi:hypothetical protein